MVFQDLALWPHMTIAENIEFGLEAKRVPAEQRRQRVTEMIELVQLSAYRNAKPAELSGGEQQRVALARALALSPRILLMDEPLSALDDELNMQLRHEILTLHSRFAFTLVYVTHSRDEASALATRIIHLKHGRVDDVTFGGAAANQVGGRR
jgi:ABC-type Fe3+/spermidine/putrescine transport system ATPase subunit